MCAVALAGCQGDRPASSAPPHPSLADATTPPSRPDTADPTRRRPGTSDRFPSTEDPLPSWNETASKRAILDFVRVVTDENSPQFVSAERRIATFDNDGTLWVEQPFYTQVAFAFDRVKTLAPQHPEWRDEQPFAAILTGDLAEVGRAGESGLMKVIAATHADMTTDEFSNVVQTWIADARHPRLDKRYTELVYEPMLEVIELLQTNDFRVFIVSGGGVEFMRPWVEDVYGIPRERVIGSRVKMRYHVREGVPVITRLREIDLVDDRGGKPVGIQQVIGRRPIVVFGNSDGDFEMLEWATTAPGPSLGVIVHHTDEAREWAYDRHSHVGRLSHTLDEAPARGWVVVDMKEDWRTIFAWQHAAGDKGLADPDEDARPPDSRRRPAP